VETYGCQMNQHDSERMAGLLEQAGYDRTDDDRDADVIVINTCSVREKAEEKLYTRLGEIRMMGEESGAHPVVAVAGCVAQQEGEKLLTKSNGHVIDVLIGTQSLKMLPLLVADVGRPTAGARSDSGGSSALGPRIDLNPYDTRHVKDPGARERFRRDTWIQGDVHSRELWNRFGDNEFDFDVTTEKQ